MVLEETEKEGKQKIRRLEAIHNLIEEYSEQYKDGGFYISSSIYYKTPEYGGIGAYVNKDVQGGEVLLVIPGTEKLSYKTLASKMQPKIVQQLILDIVIECESRLPNQYHFQNISTALILMYILTKQQQKEQTEDMNTNKNPFSNMEKYLQTWQSFESLKEELDWTTDDLNKLNGTYVKYYKEKCQDAEEVIVDVIQEKLKDHIHHFCWCTTSTDSTTTSNITKQDITESFLPAWRTVNSRSHDGAPDKEHNLQTADMIPIIDLTNGLPEGSKGINVRIEANFWGDILKSIMDKEGDNNEKLNDLFSKCNKNKDIYNLPCSLISVVNGKNIKANEELFFDYGNLPPSGFLNKYGCIPTSFIEEPLLTELVLLKFPPSLLPNVNDEERIEALKLNDYPTTEKECIENNFITYLTPFDLRPMVSHLPTNKEIDFRLNEPEQLKILRQFVILAIVADNNVIRTFVQSGGTKLRGAIDPKKVGKCLTQVIDYNLHLFYEINNNETIEHLLQKSNDESISFKHRTCIMEQILHYDALAQWRHILCRYYGIPSAVDVDNPSSSLLSLSLTNSSIASSLQKGCTVCGRTLGRKQCSKCKKVGYCCRDHQISDWKFHKSKCSRSTS